MMDTQLTLVSMMERAEKYFSKKEVISGSPKGISRLTYGEIAKRTRSLSSVLTSLGVQKGDKIGTLAWNHHRHLEAYFAIPCIGAVLHTINIRLSPEHLVYIINHAEDKILMIDEDLVPLIEKIKDEIPHVEAFIIMNDSENVPETSLEPAYSYEKQVKEGNHAFEFSHTLSEWDPAGMCYTSATTGKPKGVVYNHRGIVLHSLALGLSDTMSLSEKDVSMPVVPMFHVNAWGTPFACTWFGTTQVLPGPYFTPQLLAELIESEKVTMTAGVPTIWNGLLKVLETGNYDMSSLRAIICGGSAAPKGMIRKFEEQYGIPFYHAYGMTETTPLVTISRLKSYEEDLSYEEKLEIKSKQGLVAPGLDIRVINQNGEVKHDGKDMGELLVRGPWIASEYYKNDRSGESFKDGWLYTGDIATIDEEGSLKLVDRTKDLVKSGGEWISSVDLENALMAHPAVFEAAVIAVPDPKWDERPLACVVLKDADNHPVTKDELIDYLRPQFAKWWLPDDVVFMDEIPKTSVGKFLKRALREKLSNYNIQ